MFLDFIDIICYTFLYITNILYEREQSVINFDAKSQVHLPIETISTTFLFSHLKIAKP